MRRSILFISPSPQKVTTQGAGLRSRAFHVFVIFITAAIRSFRCCGRGNCKLAGRFGLGKHGAAEKMKNGLYSITTNGFDGVDWPPGGVVVLQNGMLLGGGSFTYFVGSYSLKDGIVKGDCVINPHTPPPPNHLYFNAKDIGVGLSGTYEGDQAELTATVLIGTRSLTLQMTLRKLADI
jgi:hypothetical protein